MGYYATTEGTGGIKRQELTLRRPTVPSVRSLPCWCLSGH